MRWDINLQCLWGTCGSTVTGAAVVVKVTGAAVVVKVTGAAVVAKVPETPVVFASCHVILQPLPVMHKSQYTHSLPSSKMSDHFLSDFITYMSFLITTVVFL